MVRLPCLAQVRAAAMEKPAPWALDRIDQRQLPLDGAFDYYNIGTGVNVYIVDTVCAASAARPHRAHETTGMPAAAAPLARAPPLWAGWSQEFRSFAHHGMLLEGF